MDKEYYLKEGKFTKFTKTIENALHEIKEFDIERNLSGKISYYLTDVLQWKNPSNMWEFRKRTASDIIESGYYNSCSDRGIVFVALARLAGIPTKYIETIKEKNLEEKPSLVSGHAFADVFIDGKWRKYEPNNGFMKNGEYYLGKNKYIKVGEGLDFSELKLNSGEIVNLNSVEKIKELRDNGI